MGRSGGWTDVGLIIWGNLGSPRSKLSGSSSLTTEGLFHTTNPSSTNNPQGTWLRSSFAACPLCRLQTNSLSKEMERANDFEPVRTGLQSVPSVCSACSISLSSLFSLCRRPDSTVENPHRDATLGHIGVTRRTAVARTAGANLGPYQKKLASSPPTSSCTSTSTCTCTYFPGPLSILVPPWLGGVKASDWCTTLPGSDFTSAQLTIPDAMC